MKVAVGLSGGVDSSVAAALLKEKGYEVIGISMKIWSGSASSAKVRNACYGPDEMRDIEDAHNVADTLGIPFYVVDLAQEYERTILHYFKKEYTEGRTPNPCIKCNQKIKFEKLLEKTSNDGIAFDYFATGHYAKVEFNKVKGRYLLKKAKDLGKDQSYWLAFLSQTQLGRSLFPLGDYTKHEVRKMAHEYGLNTSDKADSQDFYAGDHRELLGVEVEPGPIIDATGNVLGTHRGIWSYTIGQRKGLGISSSEPLYVVAIDKKRNAIVVGPREALLRKGLVAKDINCIAMESVSRPMEIKLKTRYAQKEFAGVLSPPVGGRIPVRFKEPQAAIAPGQAVVFYDEDTVVAGAIIEE